MGQRRHNEPNKASSGREETKIGRFPFLYVTAYKTGKMSGGLKKAGKKGIR
jgi:hypothetical protein